MHESISTPINSFSYYYGVKEYFEKVIHKTELDVDDFSVFFMSQCFTSSSTGWCNCSGSGESCADPGTNCSGSCTSMPPDPDEEPPYSGGGPGVGTLSPWIFDWNDPNSNGVNVDWVRGGGSGGGREELEELEELEHKKLKE